MDQMMDQENCTASPTLMSRITESSSAALAAVPKRGSPDSIRRNLNSYLMKNQASSSLATPSPTSSSRKRKREPSGIQALMPQLTFSNGNSSANIITPATSSIRKMTTQTRLPLPRQHHHPPMEEDSIGSFGDDSNDLESVGIQENNPLSPPATTSRTTSLSGPSTTTTTTTRKHHPQTWIYYDSNRRRSADTTGAKPPPSRTESGPSIKPSITTHTNWNKLSLKSSISTRTETTTAKGESSSSSATSSRTNPVAMSTNHLHEGSQPLVTDHDAILGKNVPSFSANDDVAHTRRQPQATDKNSSAKDAIQLNAKQAQAVQAIKDKKNVFLTGVAGTGKSVVLRQVLKYCSGTYQPNQWVAVAPTGVTAIAIEGQTIHSFAGIGIPYTQTDFQKSWMPRIRNAWRELKIMVIEEISMIAGEFLDRMDTVVRHIRGVDAPFGGIQLMICGDFLQLPPIAESPAKMIEMRARAKNPKDIHGNRGFAFQSNFWKEAKLETIHLTEVFRQNNPQFIKVLSNIRRGIVDEEANTFLVSCARPLTLPNKDIKPTRLYSKNVDVNRENMSELALLDGDTYEYKAVDHVIPEEACPEPGTEEKLWNCDFFRQTVAEDLLKLKVGAQVMLVKNENVNNRTLVNGSRGIVVEFTDEKPDAPFDIPITIPRFNSDRAKKKDVYPIVKFQNGETRILGRVEFTSRIVGVGRCVRLAVPLKLAWAITVHKSQGMTLDYVKIDLCGVFCEAQAYVALSRAKDENCLELRNFFPRAVKANVRALAFYDKPNDEIPNWDHRAKWTRVKVKVEGTQKKEQEKEKLDSNKKLWI